jgi:hypothetical protein
MSKRGNAERWQARGERLAAALRENLKRRKQQARGRDLGRDLGRDRAPNETAPADQTATPSPEFRRNRSRE